MSMYESFKDNIEHKIIENEEIRSTINILDMNFPYDDTLITIRSRAFKKIRIKKKFIIKTLKDMKKYNDEMIEFYLKKSFEQSEKKGE